jgi:hypothetical protein
MKKWSQRISLSLFGIIILALVFVFIRSTYNGRFDDSGLELARANIPHGANAFDVLQSATNQLWWPDNQNLRLTELANDTNWDGKMAELVLATNREALAAWDAAVKLPDLQVPEVSSFDELMPYLGDWKTFARVAQVRQNILLHDGKDQEAFDQIISEIKIGRRMENSGGNLITYLVGVAVENLGLGQLRHWTGKVHLPAERLKDYSRQIEPAPGAEAEAFANAIKAEYQVDINTLNAMRRGNSTNAGFPRHGMVWPIFDFRQSRALFAKGSLALLNAAPKYYMDVDVAQMDARPGTASILLSGNPVGEILYSMLMPALGSTLVKKSSVDVQVRSTQTILALRAHQLTHGKLPDNLDALVPEFLDKVPVDAFNGQPLHYSVEKKIVYSVGKNLKDDGGDDRSNAGPNQNHLDLDCKFDF